MSANLCTLERAKLNLPSALSADERLIDALVAAASEAIRRWCRRAFTLGRYDEVLDGTPSARLLLREHPLQSVESVRYSPQSVLEVTNTASAANQQARVAVTSAGLELVRVASGTPSRDTSVSWSANPTLQAVAAAVNALGNGWSARVVGSATGDYGLWPAQDLYVPPVFGDAVQSQGFFDCRGRWAGLSLHVAELAGYAWDSRGWIYRRDPWGDAGLLGWDYQAGAGWGGWQPWTGGPGYWRVGYTAGYAELPEALVEACASWAAILFYQAQRDPAVASESVAAVYSRTWKPPEGEPPAPVKALLAAYRRYTV
jgi:hypothetical protein